MRRCLIVMLGVCLLLRSAAGLAMQIEMAYAVLPANSMVAKVLPPCHEALQTSAAPTVESAATAAESSACSLCCVAVAIPNTVSFMFYANTYPAPTAALFNSLPAAAQRPAKPPLV